MNCITNANYFERCGIVCQWTEDALVIANPGDFRMPLEMARRPGTSDPRNSVLLKLFALIESGERAGSGMSKIYAGWAEAGYAEPLYETSFDPDRTVLTLSLYDADDVCVLKGTSQVAGQDAGQVRGTSRKGARKDSPSGISVNDSWGTSQKGTSQSERSEEASSKARSMTMKRMELLLEFCITPRTRQEMQQCIGVEARRNFIETYLNPLIEQGRLIMTIPDKPNSRNQRYIVNPNYIADGSEEEAR